MIAQSIRKGMVLLILAGLLAGCGWLPTPGQPTSRIPSIDLKPCTLGASSAQCGTLRVYENRAARSGRMIDLYVAVIKAQSDHPAPDPIFYLAGGPGVAATQDGARQQFPSSLSENHDLVFVDQRGTGNSHRILIPPLPDLSGLTTRAEMEAKLAEWAPNALKKLDMDPRFYTTSVAMDDLDEVRQALGYDKINLFGHSYGATAIQYYLRQHEDRVRTVVLLAGSLLDIPIFERWTVNAQRALDMMFDRCAADAACQAAYPDSRQEFAGLLERLAQQEVIQKYTNPTDQQPGTVIFTRDYLTELVRVMMLDAKNAARLPLDIHRAFAEDDWSDFTHFAYTDGAGDWGDQLMEHVIRCSEKLALNSSAEVARLGAGTYVEGWYNQMAENHASACKLTPIGETPEGMAAQPPSQVPVLIINGDADPQGPPESMAGSKELWPNSLLVIEPYQGHWLSDMTEIGCRWKIMAEFVENASVADLHTDCMQSVKPPAFLTD